MKKIKYLLFVVFIGIIGLNYCYAASLSVSANKKTVVVGSTVTVTVNASGADGWEYCIDYDSSILSLSSSTVGNNGSLSCVRTGGITSGGSKVKFVFKARKSGSTTVGVKSASMLDYTGKEINFSKGSVSITARTQAEIEASYSDNAYLSNLRVVDYEIAPEFKKDVYEYNLEVENNVEKITIRGTKADSSASISGTGEKELTEGMNSFKIVVTAEKGNKKTYTININRKELNPINVKVDDKDYTVVRKEDVLTAPTYYTSTTIKINDEDVPAFVSEITGYTLVGLKDEEGNISLYSYNEGDYKLYQQIDTEGFIFIPEEAKELIEGYEYSETININDLEVKVYTGEKKSDFVLVYGMNARTGEKNWYQYDTKEGTFQRYVESENNDSKDYQLYFWLTVVFAVLSGITIVLVIVLMALNSKIRKKNNRLIKMLENNKDKEKEVSNNKEEEKEEDNSDELSREDIEETIINNIAKANSDNFTDELEETKTDLDESIHDTEILEEIKTREEEVDKKALSKREIRRLEKEKALKEARELKKMRDDFLKTEEFEMVDVSDDETESKKNKKGKRKKK